jgi:hypothetical protein
LSSVFAPLPSFPAITGQLSLSRPIELVTQMLRRENSHRLGHAQQSAGYN